MFKTKYILLVIMSLVLGYILFALKPFENPINETKKHVEIIGKESLIKLDSRIKFSSVVNNSPGNGMYADVNPPRFRWYYVQNPKEIKERIDPKKFRFQISDNKDFKNKIVNVDSEFNFYNELAPFPEGKEYFWRVGYIHSGETEPSSWTQIFSVHIPKGTPKWDRTALKNPNFKGHPRLLFKKTELAKLKNLAEASEVFKKQIVIAAEEMRNHKWWNDWPKDDTKVPEFTESKSEGNKKMWNISRKLTQTAFAYLITKDESYANILDIWTTIAAYPKGGPASPEGMGNGYTESEDSTSITEYLACIYDWFYDDLSLKQRKIFEASLEWRISDWMYDFRWGGAIYTDGKENPKLSGSSIAISGGGHAWEGMLDTFPAAIVLYEKSETARKYFHWVANYLIAVGEIVAQNDGYGYGSHYSQSHMKWLVYQLMYLNKALPELQLGKNPLYKKYAEFFTGLVPVGMKYSHFGRLSQYGGGMAMRKEVFNLLAYLLGDGEVLKNWENISDEKDNFIWRQWIHVASPLQFEGTLKAVSSTKTKYVHPIIGYVMAHKYNPTEKKAFEQGVGVMFGSKPSREDDYNNENSFQMYAYGQHLNYGGHSGNENPYGHQTIAHNTIMVDGIGQTITKESKENGYRAVLMAYQEGENYTYWMGDATNAYPKSPEIVVDKGWSQVTQIDYDSIAFGEKGAPQLERFRRHMLFMRDKYLVIFDDLKTSQNRPSRFSWRYRILPDCELKYNQDDGLLTYALDSVKVHIKHIAYPKSLQLIDLKDLDQYKNPITGRNYLDNKFVIRDMENETYRNQVAKHNLWFTTEKPLDEHHFLTVIYPVKPGTSEPIISRLDDNTVKIEKDGETDVISFDKNTKHSAKLIVDLEELRLPITFN